MMQSVDGEQKMENVQSIPQVNFPMAKFYRAFRIVFVKFEIFGFQIAHGFSVLISHCNFKRNQFGFC